MAEALHEVLPAGLLGALHHFGVGRREIRRGDGIQILVEQEPRHRAVRGVAGGLLDRLPKLLRGEQVSVADRAVIRVVLPLGRGEAPVAGLLARRARKRPSPEVAPLLRRLELDVEQLGRPRGKAHRRVTRRLGKRERIEREGGLGTGHGYWRSRSRLTITRMIWLVPSRIEWTRRSRQKRSIG